MYPEDSTGGVGEERADLDDLLAAGDLGSSNLDGIGEGAHAALYVGLEIQLGGVGVGEGEGERGGGGGRGEGRMGRGEEEGEKDKDTDRNAQGIKTQLRQT
jgi:hypothetical protein